MPAPISLSFPYTAGENKGVPDWRYIIVAPVKGLHLPRLYFHEGSLYAFSEADSARDAVIRDYEGVKENPQGWMIDGTKVKTDEFWRLFAEQTQHPRVLLDTVARQAQESMKDL
jgi:hypothetical protein